MRKPARIELWMSPEELAVWVRDAPTRQTYQIRLAIWLTYIGPFHAHEVADMLQVSRQAVWLWVGQYNKDGPQALERKGRGGRRWGYLSWTEEEALLAELHEKAVHGEVLTAQKVLPYVCQATDREVSLDYVYKLLHRHGWRKLGPRPRHLKADIERQERFKKNSLHSSAKR